MVVEPGRGEARMADPVTGERREVLAAEDDAPHPRGHLLDAAHGDPAQDEGVRRVRALGGHQENCFSMMSSRAIDSS
ncbi:hypothetical protein GA0115253_104792 [Streptomyces sp. Termitarium-T10T-6]|nr:hypothetical protein GA0115253_104792 [Streptomyces sp. Termitarium-T10T-6]